MGRRRGNPLNRTADIAIAGAAFVLASPVLGLAAIAVKLTSRGPVLYRQTRVGRDGVDFELLKLRTMVVGSETDECTHEQPRDRAGKNLLTCNSVLGTRLAPGVAKKEEGG